MIMKDRIISRLYRSCSLVYDLISFAYTLPRRIRYKIYRNKSLRSYQINFEKYLDKVNSFAFNATSEELSILPGRPLKNEELATLEKQPQIEEYVKNAFSHRYKILSDTYLDTNHDNDLKEPQFSHFLNDMAISSEHKYQRINWHKDFKSGYEWNSETFYTNIKVAEQPGADIKVPRELSRFNHVGLLLHGNRIAGKSGSNEFMIQVIDWIAQNKCGYGVNWACAMDVGLRAVNWIFGISVFRNELKEQPEFMKVIKKSLYFHGIHIEHNLEYSPITTGNHYLSDIIGLLYISAFLEEVEESDRWLLFSIQEIISEMKREVYDDGMAHEGSTHYHRLVTELFIAAALIIERIPSERLQRLNRIRKQEYRIPSLKKSILKKINVTGDGHVLPEIFYRKLLKMTAFTAAVTKNNNRVPQFGDNDSARVHKIISSVPEDFSDHRHIVAITSKLFGIKSSSITWNEQCEIEANILTDGLRLNLETDFSFRQNSRVYFPEAGIALIKEKIINLIVTCGQNGQVKRGGHNHNDKLSFELNLFGHDVFVDSGCPVYTANPIKRNYFRATATHNTIQLGSREQDEWTKGIVGLFSLRQKTSPRLVMKGNSIEGVHFGYPIPHYRQFIVNEESLVIKDIIRSKEEKIFNLTIDPKVKISEFSQNSDEVNCVLVLPSAEKIHLKASPIASIDITKVDFGYSYGIFGTTNRISLKLKSSKLVTHISWIQNESR